MKSDQKNSDSSAHEDMIRQLMKPGDRKTGFKVPEGYFEELPGQIQSLINTPSSDPSFAHSSGHDLFGSVWIRIATAAVIIIALFLSIPLNKSGKDISSNTADTSNISAAYDASYANDATHSDYVSAIRLMEDPSEKIDESVSSITISDDGITDEDIIEYLKEQELDTDVLAQL
jgi:hypothetical protein